MKTKLLIILMSIMLFPCAIMAQSVEPSTEFTVDVGSFTGIVAIVTFFATQVVKLLPFVGAHRWAKILTSMVLGIVVCIACWGMTLTPFLNGLNIWEVLLYGLAVGLSGCGFYDVMKPLLGMFGQRKEEETV